MVHEPNPMINYIYSEAAAFQLFTQYLLWVQFAFDNAIYFIVKVTTNPTCY